MRLAGMGIELAASVGVFCAVGYWIDRQLGNQRPWALVIGALLGVIGGLYNLVRHAVHAALGVKPPSRRDKEGPGGGDRSAGADS